MPDSSAARLHRFTPVYGEWPVCDLCGEREDAPIHKQPEEPSAAQVRLDQGIWTMTDAEFKAELSKEFKRGFRAGRATNQAGIDLSLQALDTLIAEGIEYKEARALLDEFRNRAVA